MSNETTRPAPADDDVADRATIARLASDTVPMLIKRLTDSELGELEVREQGWRIRLRRPSELNGRASDAPGAAAQQAAHRPATHPERSAPREQRRNVITSPAVGYFTPRDGIEPQQGLRRGDLIGHVDVLGVRVEVVAETDGTLAKVDVASGQAVEYGETIAHLDPISSARAASDV